MPFEHRRRDRRAAASAASRPARLCLQSAAMERRYLLDGAHEDRQMITRSIVRLMLAFLLCGAGSSAWATGEFLQEMRFFSRSGMNGTDELAYFHGRLGILRPTFDDNHLFAAYRQMMGGTFTDAQARQLLAPCCDAPGADDNVEATWEDAR